MCFFFFTKEPLIWPMAVQSTVVLKINILSRRPSCDVTGESDGALPTLMCVTGGEAAQREEKSVGIPSSVTFLGYAVGSSVKIHLLRWQKSLGSLFGGTTHPFCPLIQLASLCKLDTEMCCPFKHRHFLWSTDTHSRPLNVSSFRGETRQTPLPQRGRHQAHQFHDSLSAWRLMRKLSIPDAVRQ